MVNRRKAWKAFVATLPFVAKDFTREFEATIEIALRCGSKLHGFSSGGGIRVIRIETPRKKLVGYGEGAVAEEALVNAAKDLRKEPSECEYITGQSDPTSQLDSWLSQGSKFDAFMNGEDIIVELGGLGELEYPNHVEEKASRERVVWEARGFTFESFPCGKGGFSTTVLKGPQTDPWMFDIKKTGRAKQLGLALENAFKADPIETDRPER